MRDVSSGIRCMKYNIRITDPSQPAAVSLEESAAAASAPTALYDAQACKRMRQRATQHKGEKKTKGRGKNTIEKNSQAAAFCKLWQTHECVLLPAPHSRPPSASKSRRPHHQQILAPCAYLKLHSLAAPEQARMVPSQTLPHGTC